MSPSSWQTALRQLWLQQAARQNRPPRLAVLGIGNLLRCDDAAGVLVARRLAQSPRKPYNNSLLVLDAGQAPENHTAALRLFAPEVVLLVDAAEMDCEAGEIHWIEMGEIDGMSASTHTFPLSMLAKFLTLEFGCQVRILGIQPFSNEIGETVSGKVLQAVDEIVEGLTGFLSEIRSLEN